MVSALLVPIRIALSLTGSPPPGRASESGRMVELRALMIT